MTKIQPAVVFLSVVLISSAAALPDVCAQSGGPVTIFEGAAYLAETLSGRLANLGEGKIAVVDLVNLDGRPTYLGKYIAEKPATALVLQENVSVVERQLLKQLADQHQLAATGIVDLETVKELGRLGGDRSWRRLHDQQGCHGKRTLRPLPGSSGDRHQGPCCRERNPGAPTTPQELRPAEA